MKFRIPILLCFITLLGLSASHAVAQDNPDNQPHIQPRATPTPSPTPSPRATQQPKQDEYERPPFPGDAPGTPASPKRPDGYARPPFPGDAPGTSATGESSSRDSQIDLNAKPDENAAGPANEKEDPSVLQPWDPHKAAKDVEVGQYYLKLKNYRAALERFNHALIYKPGDAEAIYGLAYTQEKLDLLSLADQTYRKYLQILPNGPKSKDAEEALKRIEPHLTVRQTSGPEGDKLRVAAHDINVGETYLAGNSYDAARERFEEALRLTPDNPLIYFRLAQAYQGMQRLDPARTFYRKYLEMDPKGKFVKNARKAVGEIDYMLGKP
jgi:Tfp pilus assembly protein PilF